MSTIAHDSVSELSLQAPTHSQQIWEQEVLSQLPADYEQAARHLGAFVRVRKLRNAGDLLRGLLTYVLCFPSLRQLGAWGVLIQIGNLSHVAWRKRLHRARGWLLWLLSELLAVPAPVVGRPLPSRRIVLVDGTRLKEPGGTGDDWRAHLGYELLAGRLLEVKVSDRHTAEGFSLFAWQPGDLVVGDRGYSRCPQLACVCGAGADVLVRLAVHQVPLFDEQGQRFDVLAWLKKRGEGQHSTRLRFAGDGRIFSIRLLARSLPEEAAEQARDKERKKAKKQQRKVQADTLYLCGWLLLISTVPQEQFSDNQLFALYRARWQVELLIKRLKQLLKLVQLRGQTAQTNEATLLAVLLAFALVQGEAVQLREDLSEILLDWAQADAQAGESAEATAPRRVPTPSCVSSWAVLAVCVQTLRSIVAGPASFERLHASLPQLARFLSTRTGKRAHQESTIRRQMLTLLSPRPPNSSRLFFCSSA